MNKQIISICTLSILLTFFIVQLKGQIGFNKSKQFKNENVPPDLKNTIVQADKKIIDAIRNDRIEALKAISNKELISVVGESKFDSLLHGMKFLLWNYDLEYKDQFYVENTAGISPITIFSGFSGDNDYTINYLTTDKKVFVSLIIPKEMVNKFLITLIYGLYGDDWKLNYIQFGQFSVFNKTAIDFYQKARDEFDKGFLIDAGCDLFYGQQCLKPAAQLMQYVKEKEFVELQKKVNSTINSTYTFPIILEQITTQPEILNILPKHDKKEWFPLIKYFSRIPIKDTINLKIENQQIQRNIGMIFKGIDKNKKFIYYNVVNEMPDGSNKEINHYGFIQTLDK
jgi:hypothetical protein